jgi:hypothetical protein
MVPRQWVGALAALGLAAGAGGCATSGSTSSGSSSAPSTVGLGPVSTGPSPTTSSPSISAAATGTGASSATLRPSRGYGTYELCQGRCTGGVPSALHRPLRLPTPDGGPCPVTVHPSGPVTPSSSTEVGFAQITGSSWLGAEVTWTAHSSYTGPVLIRGGELGGGPLGFGEGRIPYDSLQLLDAGRVSPRVPAGGRAWTTYTRIRAAGCYAYQVDGTNFTESIVFRAVS